MTSSAEILLAEQLRQAGIPFEQEYRFAPPRRWRADFRAWGADILGSWGSEVLIEIDGGGYYVAPDGLPGRHSRGKGMEDDAEKQSAAAILGYRVIRATPRQVENGTALSWIRQALGLEVAA
jgi:hypothetical protein